MTRPLLLTAALVLALPAVGQGADARNASLPPALSKPDRIRVLYPDLWTREAARKQGRSWERLRRQARTRWMRQHPCADATLNRRYRLGASSWSIVLATWRCDGVPAGQVAFMRCIPEHEGGYEHPDRWNGAGVQKGWPPPPGREVNIVLGHMQGRPAWYRGARAGRAGTYLLPDRWDRELFRWAVHPVNQARTFAPLGAKEYATAGRCS